MDQNIRKMRVTPAMALKEPSRIPRYALLPVSIYFIMTGMGRKIMTSNIKMVYIYIPLHGKVGRC